MIVMVVVNIGIGSFIWINGVGSVELHLLGGFEVTKKYDSFLAVKWYKVMSALDFDIELSRSLYLAKLSFFYLCSYHSSILHIADILVELLMLNHLSKTC